MPSPAATAYALPWGEFSHGSGSRSLHTPGRTRSPRPTSSRVDATKRLAGLAVAVRVGLNERRAARANVDPVLAQHLEEVLLEPRVLRGVDLAPLRGGGRIYSVLLHG